MVLDILRAAFGLILVLFLPGFAASYALFPKDDEIDSLERLVMSFGLSIALVVLLVLGLNLLLHVPINLGSSLLIIFSVTLLCSLTGYWQRRKQKSENRGRGG